MRFSGNFKGKTPILSKFGLKAPGVKLCWAPMKKTPGWCAWCDEEATLEHILLLCRYTQQAKTHLHGKGLLPHKLKPAAWIFGHAQVTVNPVIWITNFAVYKAHLCACDHNIPDLFKLIVVELEKYSPLFGILTTFNWTSVL